MGPGPWGGGASGWSTSSAGVFARHDPEAAGVRREAVPDFAVIDETRELFEGEVLLEERQRLAESGCGWRDHAMEFELVCSPCDLPAGVIGADVGHEIVVAEPDASLCL